MSQDVVLLEKTGPVATVTLNRPDKMNSFDPGLRAAMRDTVGRLEDDRDIRVVILRGAGRGFSAGADLSAGLPDHYAFHLDVEYKPFLTGIEHSDKIWIAQVHGAAAGIGAAVAMNCDLMVMSDDAYLYMAFAAIGLVPDGGNTQLLLRHLGYKRALAAILEGAKIPAPDCLAAGIANRVVPADRLEAETRAWAGRLAQGAPRATAAAKRLLRRVGQSGFGEAITQEGLEQVPLLQSQDFREGVAAFFAKRPPRFTGT